MSPKIRDHTEVSWTRIVPRSLGRAYFNVVLGFVMLGFLIWALIVGGGQYGALRIAEFVVAFLIVVAFIPRSIAGLVVLRREAGRQSRQ